jgi:outer membrane immunogenic protein
MKMNRIFLRIIIFVAIAVVWWPVTPASAQPYKWTGFYLGGQLGAQWMDSRSSFDYLLISGSKTFHDTSFMGGGQVGFNWQLASMPLVLGLEADVIWANHDKGGEIYRFGLDHIDGRSELGVQGSIRGRLGWAIKRVLLYGTGGVGIGDCKATTIVSRDGVGSASFDKSKTRVGWTVGAGVEYALPFFSHWLIRAEYRYTDLGSINLSFPGATLGSVVVISPYNAKADFRTHAVIFGVNYKF